MNKAAAYNALVHELEIRKLIPPSELIALIGKPASAHLVSIDGEGIAIEVAVYWHRQDSRAIRISATANGPSHWKLERLEESLVIAVNPD